MDQVRKIAIGVIAAFGIGAGAVAHAHPGQTGMGQHGMGGMQHGAEGGMPQGVKEGMGHGMMRGHGGPGGQQLMTPEERTAFIEKMHAAKTPEERQKVAAANRAEMQKRAQERGIAPQERHGRRADDGEMHRH